MTKAEAKIFLSHQEADDLEDAYELIVFESKHFFITKSVVPKVFMARLEKLQKTILAADVLGLNRIENFSSTLHDLVYTDAIREWVAQHESIKNKWRKELSDCQGLQGISESVLNFLKHFRVYSSKWSAFPELSNNVKTSTEPDPMLLLEEIQQVNAIGIITFDDLFKDKSLKTENLRRESERLSRLNKMF